MRAFVDIAAGDAACVEKGPGLEVVYLDNHLLIVNKPPGIVVQGAPGGERSLASMAGAWLKERFRKPGNVYLGIVHRLDRPVSGLVVFARTGKAASRLAEQFRNRRVEKTYLAVVEGGRLGTRVLEHWIRLVDGRPRIADTPGRSGRRARLEILRQWPGRCTSQFRLLPSTGRKHQLRLQLSAVGRPIVGDRMYGAETAIHGGHGAIALFAERLTFIHPTRKVEVTVSVQPPSWWPWPPPVHLLRSRRGGAASPKGPSIG